MLRYWGSWVFCPTPHSQEIHTVSISTLLGHFQNNSEGFILNIKVSKLVEKQLDNSRAKKKIQI